MQSNPHLASSFRLVSRVASLAAIFIGCLVLVGWILNIEILKSVSSGLVAVNPATAISLSLAGAALWLLRTEKTSQGARRIAQSLACVVALVGLLKLGGILLGRDSGIDQLLFRDKLGAVGNSMPNRMAPTTALNLLLL